MAREATASHVRPSRQRGSITLVALCLTTVLGLALGSYLALCSHSAQLSGRSASHERTHQLAQSGLEEALWALNQGAWTGSGPAGTAVWATTGADRTVTLTYPLSNPAATGVVTLRVANYASAGPTWPTITSTASVTLDGGQTSTRSLQATTAPAPLFGNAIASENSYVSFVGGGTVDSWNSDPDNNAATPAVAYAFTAGSAANHAATIAARGNGGYGVILNQATVRGYVATFGLPVSFSTSGSPPAKVLGPATPAGVNVDSSRLGRSAFVPLSSVFSINLPPIGGANYGGLINNVLALVSGLLSAGPGVDTFKTSGDLAILGLPLVSPSITISRPTKLIVDGDLSISGLGQITVTATGSLELFVTGDVSIGGFGINNQTGDPKKLAVFCTSSSTSDALEYTTTQDFRGVICSEHKPIDIRQNATFYGALLSSQYVRFSNSATSPVFHYDTALRNVRFTAVTTPYVIKRLTEL